MMKSGKTIISSNIVSFSQMSFLFDDCAAVLNGDKKNEVSSSLGNDRGNNA
jgi:hypothetical protein